MLGRFLVVEGIDGCGKTTQLNELYEWLPTSGIMPKGIQLKVTREPGGTSLGKKLRRLLLDPQHEYKTEPLTELLLYAADRAQHVEEVIRPALERGDWVLSDRFCGSTLAYQGYGREMSLATISQLEKLVTCGLTPDLTLWLALSPEDAIIRIKNRPSDRMENNGIDFLKRVAVGFEKIAHEQAWIKIPAQHTRKEVSAAIKGIVRTVLSNLVTETRHF